MKLSCLGRSSSAPPTITSESTSPPPPPLHHHPPPFPSSTTSPSPPPLPSPILIGAVGYGSKLSPEVVSGSVIDVEGILLLCFVVLDVQIITPSMRHLVYNYLDYLIIMFRIIITEAFSLFSL